MLDTLTIDALRAAFAVSLERYKEAIASGRSDDWAVLEAVSYVIPRIGEVLEAHDGRRAVEHRDGKDYRLELSTAWNGSIQMMRTGTTHADAWAYFWRRAAAAVRPKELY